MTQRVHKLNQKNSQEKATEERSCYDPGQPVWTVSRLVSAHLCPQSTSFEEYGHDFTEDICLFVRKIDLTVTVVWRSEICTVISKFWIQSVLHTRVKEIADKNLFKIRNAPNISASRQHITLKFSFNWIILWSSLDWYWYFFLCQMKCKI